VIDIVSAYKSLKLVMTKNVKGMSDGREHINGKNYLKPTASCEVQLDLHDLYA
jgi:hypothetical protein